MKTQNNSLAQAKNEQMMTSVELAKMANRPHNNLLKSIRKMEEAWLKIGQVNFYQSYYFNEQNKRQPMYRLTKRECLYISTKFNDQMRAKLVVRWEALERVRRQPDALLLIDSRIVEIRTEQYRLGARLTTNKRRLKHLKATRKMMEFSPVQLSISNTLAL